MLYINLINPVYLLKPTNRILAYYSILKSREEIGCRRANDVCTYYLLNLTVLCRVDTIHMLILDVSLSIVLKTQP